MRKIVLHRRFLKDLKKLRLPPGQVKRLKSYKTILLDSGILPEEARDHKLIGNYTCFREFHIGGNIVIVYFLDEKDEQIIFTRIGSHSELFK